MSESTTQRPSPGEPISGEADHTSLLFRSKLEQEWEGRRNGLLESHPLLAGYSFLPARLVLIFASKLTTFAVAFLFLFLVSDYLTNDLRRYVPFVPKAVMFSLLYLMVTALGGALSFKLVPDALRLVPAVADSVKVQAISLFEAANARWSLTDYVTRDDVIGQITEGIKFTRELVPSVTGAVSRASTYVVYFVFALVLNLLIYHDLKEIEGVFARKPQSLLGFLYRFALLRIRIFYYYFKRVMGGQFIISAINTSISALVIFGLGLPQPLMLLLTVFVCGLMPIVGNLVSNSVLVLTAFASIGLWGALICLSLLVVVHKLEYFLNSKIIGDIVHLPMAVTLAALLVSEVVLGVVGLILAVPLVLFVRHELEHIPGLPASHPAEPSRTPSPTSGLAGPTLRWHRRPEPETPAPSAP